MGQRGRPVIAFLADIIEVIRTFARDKFTIIHKKVQKITSFFTSLRTQSRAFEIKSPILVKT